MFLISSLVVVSAVYLISALVSELIFISEEESTLPLVIRTFFGFFFSLAYFASTWQLVSIKYTWLFGVLLISLYSYGKFGPQFISVIISKIRINLPQHGKYFFIVLFGSNIFFLPMHIGNNYGPFTEGGGDISIYADITRVLTNKGLTANATPGELTNIIDNIKEVFDVHYDRNIIAKKIEKSYDSIDEKSLNPPLAESSINRVLTLKSMGTFLYAPYGAYSFFERITNYNVFFGIQAFLYCVILIGTWCFFSIYGKTSAAIAIILVLVSHGIISVFYNMYAAQALCIAFSILILNALPYIRLNSWAGLRIYGTGIAYLWTIYVHFFSVIFPVMILAISTKFFNFFQTKNELNTKVSKINKLQKLCNYISISTFYGLLIVLITGGSKKSILYLQDLIKMLLIREKNVFLGEQIEIFSMKWLSFLFGILSQQHYQPYAQEYQWLNKVISLGNMAGVCLFVLGCFLMLRIYWVNRNNKNQKKFFAIYFLLLVTVISHIYVSQFSLYTQAKGAQNVLIYFYVILLLPLSMGLGLRTKDAFIKYLTITSLVISILFCISVGVPRTIFGIRLSLSQDRSSILEPSFFQEAKKINKMDPSAFVLIEPRKSADLYLSVQPFFEMRAIHTRHLVLQKLNMEAHPVYGYEVMASELIEDKDIPHLWLLRAEKKVISPNNGNFRYQWTSQKLTNMKTPYLLLFANNYELNSHERIIDIAKNKVGKFSFLRNGVAMLYYDNNSNLDITLEPVNPKEYEKMVKEIRQRTRKGEMGSDINIAVDGKFIRLKSKIYINGKPILKTIVRYSGEYWLNVKVRDQEL